MLSLEIVRIAARAHEFDETDADAAIPNEFRECFKAIGQGFAQQHRVQLSLKSALNCAFDTIENLIKVDNRDLRQDLLLALDGIIAPTYSQKYSPELTDATVEMLIREISEFD